MKSFILLIFVFEKLRAETKALRDFSPKRLGWNTNKNTACWQEELQVCLNLKRAKKCHGMYRDIIIGMLLFLAKIVKRDWFFCRTRREIVLRCYYYIFFYLTYHNNKCILMECIFSYFLKSFFLFCFLFNSCSFTQKRGVKKGKKHYYLYIW